MAVVSVVVEVTGISSELLALRRAGVGGSLNWNAGFACVVVSDMMSSVSLPVFWIVMIWVGGGLEMSTLPNSIEGGMLRLAAVARPVTTMCSVTEPIALEVTSMLPLTMPMRWLTCGVTVTVIWSLAFVATGGDSTAPPLAISILYSASRVPVLGRNGAVMSSGALPSLVIVNVFLASWASNRKLPKSSVSGADATLKLASWPATEICGGAGGRALPQVPRNMIAVGPPLVRPTGLNVTLTVAVLLAGTIIGT